MKVLLTGAAGFIGMHVGERLLARGDAVLGLDNLNDYYSPALKQARLARLQAHAGFEFVQQDVADRAAMQTLFARADFDRVVHLAAQAGVRHSIDHPQDYIDSNLLGFGNLLEGCRHARVQHLVYASSSSVYGGSRQLPFAETQRVDQPVSLYAATKKANELMAHAYSHLYGLPATGLRFFTVYGPWGRPDMAAFLFTRAILAGQAIEVFNQGDLARDFTYIDDIVYGVLKVLDQPPVAAADALGDAAALAAYRLFNIGNSAPVRLLDFIAHIEAALGRRAIARLRPMQPGDVPATHADTRALEACIGPLPHTPLAVGVPAFVRWYRGYYGV